MEALIPVVEWNFFSGSENAADYCTGPVTPSTTNVAP